MDEQNNVDGIHKDDRLSLESNLEQKDTLNNEQARSGYDQPCQPQNYGQSGQQPYQQPYQQPQNYGPAGQQAYQQPQYSASGQPQNYSPAGQQFYQQPQYSQPGQPQYSQLGHPQNYDLAGQADHRFYQVPQYSRLGQPQYNQQYQSQQPPYGQPGQQSTTYDSPMGYVGYEYRQNVPADVKKGSTHIPNLLNIVGMIMALITVFLPYAYMDSEVRTISGVFGIDVICVIIVAVLLVTDIISAFLNKTAAYIIDLVISVIVGGALIFEFVLSLIDLGKLDKTVNAGLSFGAWFSVVTAILLLVSVPVWWAVSRKKAKSEKETAESAV